ncbi:evolutionarily conserved signaling intermediate in Toll pathway, mitochondrial [Takifugu flavidus]|uniref:Evolutionarily conserved signaling intermediate in Toll pathway, mitochondrial n=1 Tax=Takifugu flavidus TaxID=433684 RepID=A0A5C6N862_9TELE|nr:evolutionarily conserved signaling intermediate in Toll pathway, mitochondrial [Takifugu flavidus]TWW63652.1 Evolutionarily conserved signaling intermediate in [Takifugu flavidus]
MTRIRFLLQLQGLGQVGLSRFAAQHGALLQSAFCRQPNLIKNAQRQVIKHFHGSLVCAKRNSVPSAQPLNEDKKSNDSALIHADLFDHVSGTFKTKATFNKAIDVFIKSDVRRRGHVEFIYAALKKMPEFGVERDLAVYNKLLDVFPKGVFVPRNFIQRMFNHYPRQQECGVQILEQMENYGIMPNLETKVLLVQIFGEKGHPVRKYQRIMYWFPKFKELNPWPIPKDLPTDPVDLARFSLARIADDLDAQVTVYQVPHTDVTEKGEHVTLPHIVGIQSPNQIELLAKHNPDRPVFIEGPFPLWLRKTCVHYYILRADPTPADEKEECPYDPESCLAYPLALDLDLDRDMGDDETFDVEICNEGPVFAMCMTGQGDEATLNQWLSGLQQKNPILGQVPVLFLLEGRTTELKISSDKESDSQNSQHEDHQTQDRRSKVEANR